MDTPVALPASNTPPKPSEAPLRRAGTFRAPRPASTGPTGLRRGATFANRPQSYSGDASLSVLEPEHVDAVPRLRRGSSFVGRARTSRPDLGDDSPLPHLRRGSSRHSSTAAPVELFQDDPPPARRLPRAGTFSFGSSPRASTTLASASPAESASTDHASSDDGVRRASSADKPGRAPRSCGMCGNCGGVGPKGMPPWAPERLATMTPAEQVVVFQELHHKEEKGRLEAVLRKKRVQDLAAVSARLDARRAAAARVSGLEAEGAVADADVAGEDGGAGPSGALAREGAGSRSGGQWRAGSEDFDELESVDLGTEGGSRSRSSSKSSRRRGRSGSRSRGRETEFGADISANVEFVDTCSGRAKARGGRRLGEDCPQCGELEGKVRDLEEQLGVLREVVRMCADNEEAARGADGGDEADEKARKPKTWKDKVISAYFGSSAVASERTRLREEVEALRKATDFLFQKLQMSGK